MALLLRILLIVAIGYVVLWLIRGGVRSAFAGGRAAGGSVKCARCRHARKVFDDGTLCGHAGREVFKKPVHVANCTDRAPR